MSYQLWEEARITQAVCASLALFCMQICNPVCLGRQKGWSLLILGKGSFYIYTHHVILYRAVHATVSHLLLIALYLNISGTREVPAQFSNSQNSMEGWGSACSGHSQIRIENRRITKVASLPDQDLLKRRQNPYSLRHLSVRCSGQHIAGQAPSLESGNQVLM